MGREDPRLARSRDALVAAMTEALDSDEGIDRLTIAELTKRAGVSRPTFYQHFADPAALVRAAGVARLEAVFVCVPQAALGESWRRFVRGTIRTILAELHERRRFYLRALDADNGGDLSRDVIEFLAVRLRDVSPLGPVLRRGVGDDLAVARSEFLAAGVFWHVARWLQRDGASAEAIDDIVEEVSELLLTASGATPEEIATARAEDALDATGVRA
ncbi:TetR/AcrR family transcriptional regulator [Pseudoclavibacter chungangensis]|uniref:TetR/AcrR family transcriptional regulator n=1 Tax=Pseudoclavibacter chungangensis TaxID=587635 RepID=A0A7J5BUK9_9MICO|nr:TetR/AcrR family transcriptional regulator [Pseudoclavibacter chungangensis]KAB1658015.1 TetR/AcrR family transcriptional regulator [Pseudoclavibacter chungangensis]NYJ65821.1 AcrR family transcriptional regulator [Pseudoclavibacter chungangensis]